MGIWTYLIRSCRLRCPSCGQGTLFRNWFRMHERCDCCGLKYERSPGYFLGSIYVNYGLTALLVLISYLWIYFSGLLSPKSLLYCELVFSVLFPLWFFRYARSLWMGVDHYFDPPQP